jgi:ElaB/YqjD/DUF883 family membrane-anchored ribosome-binding protein
MGFAMSDYSELNCCNKQKLVEDLKTVVADAEEILRATAGVAGEKNGRVARARQHTPE